MSHHVRSKRPWFSLICILLSISSKWFEKLEPNTKCKDYWLLNAHCRKWVDCLTSVDFLKGGGHHQVQFYIKIKIRPVWDSRFGVFLTCIPGLFHCNIIQPGSAEVYRIQFLCRYCTLRDMLNVPINSMCDLAAQFRGNLMLMSPLVSPHTCASKSGQVWASK